jgi:hypothetical protein
MTPPSSSPSFTASTLPQAGSTPSSSTAKSRPINHGPSSSSLSPFSSSYQASSSSLTRNQNPSPVKQNPLANQDPPNHGTPTTRNLENAKIRSYGLLAMPLTRTTSKERMTTSTTTSTPCTILCQK